MTPKDTLRLVDPELRPMLQAWIPGSISAENLAAVRAASTALTVAGQADETVERREAMVPGRDGHPDVRVLAYTPRGAAAERPAILHMHGGGYVLGSADGLDIANRLRARELDCVVASVDYRLAPETCFPGSVEDCYAALTWLHASAAALGVDRGRIALAGESAGGGLAAGLALMARDRGEISLAFQMLVFPMLDDRTCVAADPHPFAGEFIWTPDSNRFGWASLLGCEPGGEGVSPYAAAARAEDLSGLPPAFISVGSLDLFVDENLEYARRLMRAGVPVELHVYPGAYHAFQANEGARAAKAAQRDVMAALARAFEPQP